MVNRLLASVERQEALLHQRIRCHDVYDSRDRGPLGGQSLLDITDCPHVDVRTIGYEFLTESLERPRDDWIPRLDSVRGRVAAVRVAEDP